MADFNETKSSPGEKSADPGLKTETTPNPVEEINPANDRRSLDVGESGQFVPGGLYNELGATKPRRIDLDEQADSSLSNEER